MLNLGPGGLREGLGCERSADVDRPVRHGLGLDGDGGNGRLHFARRGPVDEIAITPFYARRDEQHVAALTAHWRWRIRQAAEAEEREEAREEGHSALAMKDLRVSSAPCGESLAVAMLICESIRRMTSARVKTR